ncbi:hypothetical protein BaRGS_00027316 [Batillaria attramentaria]|uniref:Rieske domain-containing protein n=1 Tax=Batillaria attramentaria TaxID=370345 RepID=A0ABD0K3M1_9CAEN
MAQKSGQCVVVSSPATPQENFTLAAPSRSVSSVEGGDGTLTWRLVGEFRDLIMKKCRRVYSKKGSRHDLGLFFHNGTFYALGAWCGHMGGPLFEGDIEDYKGSCHVMCPWHAYMFDLKTGKNEIGLEQSTHEVRVADGKVYIKHESPLSLYPFL